MNKLHKFYPGDKVILDINKDFEKTGLYKNYPKIHADRNYYTGTAEDGTPYSVINRMYTNKNYGPFSSYTKDKLDELYNKAEEAEEDITFKIFLEGTCAFWFHSSFIKLLNEGERNE